MRVSASSKLPLLGFTCSRQLADDLAFVEQVLWSALRIDEGRPVRSSELYDAISAVVARGNLAQLVIYFAGHGFVNSYAEYWMLSLAPDNPNEAVSLRESIELARLSAIPNVVIISDACRSRADSLSAELVRGSMIFPSTRTPPTSSSEVDQFLATLIGNASFEAPVAQSAGDYAGIYTSAFLAAFHSPDPSMVRDVNGISVVTNAKLKGYLTQQVPRLAERASIHTTQHPDTRIASGESSYIGRTGGAPRNTAYTQDLAASGGVGPYTWTLVKGRLPPNLSISAQGRISGTPTVAGATQFTLKVSDAANVSNSRTFGIKVQ